MRRVLAGLALALTVALGTGAAALPAAHASALRPAGLVTQVIQVPTVAHLTSAAAWHPIPRWHAYLWAIEDARGCPYNWGGNGPCGVGYDCSGLVVAAYAHVGIWLPRTTWEMLGYWRVRWIPLSQARAGDLIFMYGGAHVELYTGHWGWTFGAHTWGQPSSFTQWSNVLGAYRVLGAG